MRAFKKPKSKTNVFLKKSIAMLLMVLMVVGSLPLGIMADIVQSNNNRFEQSDDMVIVRFNGEEYELSDSDTIFVDIHEDGELVEIPIMRYIPIDGEMVRIDDPRIGGIVRNLSSPQTQTSGRMSPFSNAPPIQDIIYFETAYTPTANVNMYGNLVWGLRYLVVVGTELYEMFCLDPHRRGPEDGSFGWDVLTAGNDTLVNVLRYGFPRNSALSDESIPIEVRRQNAYTTRVAVAMAIHGAGNFTGNSTILANAQGLINGTWPSERTLHRGLSINGVVDAKDLGKPPTLDNGMAVSERFNIEHSRVANYATNQFQFSWTDETPNGAELWINGAYWDTKAGSSNHITPIKWFYDSTPDVPSAVDYFEIKLPHSAQFEGQTASVNLRGVNEEWAGQAWIARSADFASINPNDRPSAGVPQDLVFYIPSVEASAAFSFEEDDLGLGRLRISKTNTQGQPRAGATFNITGPDPMMPMNGVNVPIGGWLSPSLMLGTYTITEITPPSGYSLASNPTQTIEVTENHTTTAPAIVTFANERITTGGGFETQDDTSVTIQKIDAITRENIHGAMVRLVGMTANHISLPDGQTISFNNTGVDLMQVLSNGAIPSGGGGITSNVGDGVWQIDGLPYGFYMVYEYRAPDGYSILPAHTARGFWLAPPNVTIDINQEDFNFDGSASQNNVNVTINVDGSTHTGGGGGDPSVGWSWDWNINIPGASRPLPDFEIITQEVITGANIIFENYPFSEIEIIKREASNGIGNNQLLAGATFRIQGFFVEGNTPTVIDRTTTTDASGRIVFGDLPAGAYTVTELAPPSGYILGDNFGHPSVWHVNVGWGQSVARGTAPSHTFFNIPKSSLEVLKIDGITNAPLAGAIFDLSDPTTSESWQTTSNAQGIAIFGKGNYGNFLYPNRTYILREIVAPDGYVLMDTPREIVLSPGDNNRVTISNYQNPALTIIKRDAITQELLAGAIFEVEYENGQTISGSPFATDDNGRAVLPWTLFDGQDERTLLVTEISAPNNYGLSNPNWRLVTMRQGEDNTVTFENLMLPTLVITKWNALTYQPVPLTRFRVEYEVPNSGNVIAVGEFVTDRNGQIILPFVGIGWYRITETHPAPGMQLNSNNSYRVFLGAGQNTYQLLQQVPSIRNAISGVQFTILPSGSHSGDIGGGADNGGNADNQFGNQLDLPYTHEELEDKTPQERLEFLSGGLSVTGGSNWLAGEGIWNFPLNSIVVKKSNSVTGQLLQGATFEVIHTSAGVSGTLGTVIGRYETDNSGIIVLTGLTAGSYVVREVQAPNNFTLSVNNTQTVFLQADGHSVVEANFANDPYGSLLISKRCEATSIPLADAVFRVTNSNGTLVGTANGLHRTNAQGEILIPNLAPDSYIVTEVEAPDGFILNSTPQTIRVEATGETYRLEFTNRPLSSLIVRKQAADDGSSLAGARFTVTRTNGELIGHYTTDATGTITIQGLLGWFNVTETHPPTGFGLSTPNTQVVEVRSGSPTVVTFANPRLSNVTIHKISGNSDNEGRPLAGVVFEIARLNGERIRNPQNNSFEFATNAGGLIHLPRLEAGSYVATETRPLAGYLPAEPYFFEVTNDQDLTITIRNYKLPSVVIRKIDGDTNQPLAGVQFEFARYFGNGSTGQRLKNYALDNSYTFTTDASGHIYLSTLEHGTWIAIETRPLAGYLTAEPTVFTVGANGDMTIIIRNYRMANLTIQKINSITRAPLAGVGFEINRPDGTRVINPQTGFHEFITNHNGIIFLPNLADGRYYLNETRPLQGFIVDEAVIPFNINAEARRVAAGNTGTNPTNHVLIVENTPASGLVIIKTDAQTGRPLAGVEFEVRHADGRLVSGQMLHGNQPSTPANSPQLSANGLFLTDRNGRINLNHLAAGVYHVRETRTLDGFMLDTTVHTVTVFAGQQTTLQVQNIPLGGVRLLKICAFTERPLHNVEFTVFDRLNNVVGVFYTDNRGIIDFTGILAQGRYTIRETRPAQGFFRDDVPRTIEIIAGVVTEIVWENVPYAGQIQILKVSADHNEQNGLPSGTPLEGAIFEIRDQHTGNLVDRIMSDNRGMAVSRPLPLGRYLVEEVQSPQFYALNARVMDVTIEFARQIVRLEFANQSVNLGVSVSKTGPQVVMSGQNLVVYEIRQLRNESSVPLYDFFFRESFPVDAFRVERIVTGTFNHSLRYRVEATTNTGRTVIVNDNLQSTRNNALDMRPAALGLAMDEFVIEVVFIFGYVQAGFSMVQNTRIEGRILHQVFPMGFQFANHVDVGGRHNGEWIVNSSRVVTTVFTPINIRLPQTGR